MKRVYHCELAAISGSTIRRVTIAESVHVSEAGRVSLKQVKRNIVNYTVVSRYRYWLPEASNRAASKDGIVHTNE